MNRGDDEDSDYEESIYIQQKEILSVANARRILKSTIVTVDLLGIDDSEFLGIKATQFLKKNLTEVGFFLFVNTKKWEMTEEEKKVYGPAKL